MVEIRFGSRMTSLPLVATLAEAAGAKGTMWAPDGRHFAYRKHGSDTCPGGVDVRDADGRLVASFPASAGTSTGRRIPTRFATWIDFWETIAIYDR